MSRRVPFLPARALPKLVIAGLVATTAAACSSDTSRFAESPFANPFASSNRYDPTGATGSIGAQPQQAPPARIEAQPLPPVAGAPAAPAGQVYAARPQMGQPQYQPQAQYQPQFQPQPQAAAPVQQPARPAGWSAQGGTGIVVAQGETIGVLADRYGVPASAILAANGLTNASQVRPGQRLTIPVYSAVGTAAAPAARAPAPVAVAPKPVAPAPKPVAQKPAEKPVRTAAIQPVPAQPAVKPAAAPAAPAPAPVVQKPAQQPQAAAPVAPAPKPEAQPKAAQPEVPDQTASIAHDGTEFRWPARGRIIAGFNGKGGNEGINIALPEGTPVKASEGGTVAYSGSELKGYGNLVLIRHDNGFVSAYAHNGELMVKRGDKVRRGQVIAKSGQSGNVSSPQLHFELRKGSTPVDPMQHLAGL